MPKERPPSKPSNQSPRHFVKAPIICPRGRRGRGRRCEGTWICCPRLYLLPQYSVTPSSISSHSVTRKKKRSARILYHSRRSLFLLIAQYPAPLDPFLFALPTVVESTPRSHSNHSLRPCPHLRCTPAAALDSFLRLLPARHDIEFIPEPVRKLSQEKGTSLRIQKSV